MNRVFNKRINLSSIVVVFILFVLFKPESFSVLYKGLNNAFNIARIFILLFVVGRLVAEKKIFDIGFASWSFFGLFLLMVTLFQDGDIFLALINVFSMLSLAGLIILYKERPMFILRQLYFVFYIYLVLNLLSLIIWPNGMYVTGMFHETTENWFLGFKNKHILYALPAICISLVMAHCDEKKFTKVILILISTSTILYTKSSTAIIGISSFAIILLFEFVFRRKLFFYQHFAILSIVLFFAFPVFQLSGFLGNVATIFSNKVSTIGSRVAIWNTTLSYFYESPFFGYGIQFQSFRNAMYGSTSYVHAHNQFLEYLFEGGIFGLSLFLAIVFNQIKNVKMFKNSIYVLLFSSMFMSFQIVLVSEAFSDSLSYISYFLIWLIPYLSKRDKNLKWRRGYGNLNRSSFIQC